VLVVAFFISIPKSSPSKIKFTEEIVVDKARFGVIIKDSDNKLNFKETNHIPYKVGLTYVWMIHLKTTNKKVTWREEFFLPAPAIIWDDDRKSAIRVSDDKKKAIKIETVTPENGWIINGWSIAEGDPKGKHVMKIYIEGEFVKEFIFYLK